MIRIGVLGASRIAAPAVVQPAAGMKGVGVVCVAASDPSKAEKFAAEHGIASVAQNYAALVERKDVDLVYNALTPRDHMQWTMAALDAGKHVLCEKPFAMNAHQARQMVQRAAATGNVLLEAFHYRFHPLFARLMKLAQSNRIGALKKLTASFQVGIAPLPGEFRHDPELGGGATMDLGCYPVHWARSLFGSEPSVLRANAVKGKPGVDMSMSASLQFAEGQLAEIACSMAADTKDGVATRLEIQGTRGTLEVDNPIAPHTGHELRGRTKSREWAEVVSGNTTFAHQLQHVVDVICNGAAPLTGGSDAVANMAVIDAIYRRAGMRPRGESS